MGNFDLSITYNVAMENASHEALVRQAYKDSVNVWTWSFGLTNATGHRVERYIGNPQTVERCIEVYLWALDNYADHVRRRLPNLTETQFAAALSFVWNLGAGNFGKASWVGHFLNGDMERAEANWKSWNRANNKVNQGLVARRQKECDLFFRGKWSHDGTVIEYTRLTSTNAPDFRSGKRINIDEPLKRLIGVGKGSMVPDTPPRPDAETIVPTLTPEQAVTLGNLLWRLFLTLKEIFKGG